MSADGSHILMLTEGGTIPGPPYHLYMTVNDAIHYDVSKGSAVEFVGMTRDGSSVTFTSEERLAPGDTDDSIDLYRWNEASDSLTLLSIGNNKGNSNDCSATWIEGCGVEVPNTERRSGRWPRSHSATPMCPTSRRRVWMTSPLKTAEMSSSTRPSCSTEEIRNPQPAQPLRCEPQRCAFHCHDGSGHAGQTDDRFRGTAAFAAFLTRSRLTSYDNRGSTRFTLQG